jgi:O-antigen/teichoic acid export membrane protein
MHYGVRVQIGSIFQFANGRLDVLVMQFFRPLSQVGYYAIAETVAELLINVAGAFQMSVMPLISHYEAGGEEQAARAEATSSESLRHYGILAAVAAIALAMIGPVIIYFAFGPEFEKAIAPMLILLPGVWFLGIAVVIQGDLSGRGRPGLSSILAGIAAVATVVFDFVLIPPLGVYGGAIASDIAYTTYGVGSLIALSRVTGLPIRRLIVPTVADFGLYARLLRQGATAVRKRVRARHA